MCHAVEDWDAMEAVWSHGFRELKCDVSERPVVLSESAYSITSQRERTVCTEHAALRLMIVSS